MSRARRIDNDIYVITDFSIGRTYETQLTPVGQKKRVIAKVRDGQFILADGVWSPRTRRFDAKMQRQLVASIGTDAVEAVLDDIDTEMEGD